MTEFPRSLAPTTTLQVRGNTETIDLSSSSIFRFSYPMLELLVNFTAARFSCKSEASTDGIGAVIDMHVDVEGLLRLCGISTQAALQRLAIHLSASNS